MWMLQNKSNKSSYLLEQMSFFHDHTLLILTLITCLVGYMKTSLLVNKYNYRFLLERKMKVNMNEMAAWYWHSVDVVWLFPNLAIY